MNDLAKLNITKDSFIYSINQAYEARIQHDGNFNSHLKFEPFLDKTWTLPQKPDLNSFKKTLGEIIEHHYKKLPNYRREESVNIENISWFSHSMAALFADIEYLLFAYTGHGYPTLTSSKMPRTNSSKNILFAIKKYMEFKENNSNGEKFQLFPLLGEDNACVDDSYTNEIWSLIFYFVKKFFGVYAELVDLFATWKYMPKVDSSDVVDWNVRPPCGELYRKQFKHLFEKDYFKNNSKKAPANHNGANAEQRNGSPAKSQLENSENIEKPHSNFTEKPRKDFGEKQNDRRQKSFKERKEHSHRPSEEERQKKQDEAIAKALHEVDKAIKTLKKNSDISELELSPQNSFIRRQQHVVISDAGFGTESRGEGDNRCVCIIRK